GLAHAARDDGGVAGLATAAGEDALGRDHAGQVVGVGLAAYQDDVLALCRLLGGAVAVEDDLADGGTRTRVDALGDLLLLRAVVAARAHALRELGAVDPAGRLAGDA